MLGMQGLGGDVDMVGLAVAGMGGDVDIVGLAVAGTDTVGFAVG